MISTGLIGVSDDILKLAVAALNTYDPTFTNDYFYDADYNYSCSFSSAIFSTLPMLNELIDEVKQLLSSISVIKSVILKRSFPGASESYSISCLSYTLLLCYTPLRLYKTDLLID